MYRNCDGFTGYSIKVQMVTSIGAPKCKSVMN